MTGDFIIFVGWFRSLSKVVNSTGYVVQILVCGYVYILVLLQIVSKIIIILGQLPVIVI